MLVLSRQRDETIMIGDDTEITIVDIRGDKVRLGISAPAWVAVHRKEVYEAIKAENRRASSLAGPDVESFPRPERADGSGERLRGIVQRRPEPGPRPGRSEAASPERKPA